MQQYALQLLATAVATRCYVAFHALLLIMQADVRC
jgi:hypothetical protein